jgi:type I restriction enzyme S subunit
MVPNGWQKTDLSNFINIKHGFAFKSEYFSDSGNYILLTPGSFYETGGYRDQGAKTKYYIGEIPESYLLTKGELLVAMTEQAAGLLGSTMFVPESNVYLHNQRLGKIVIEAHEQIDKEFLYLTFNAPHTRRQISSQSTGTKVKHTSPDKLKSVVCLLPPIGEQRKIAKILSTWDKTISTTERLIDNSKQQKKALMEQLLKGKKRLLDTSGKPFQGEWEEVKLGNVLTKISNGLTYDSKATTGLPVSRIETISTGKVNHQKVGYAPDQEKTRKFKLMKGDILYSHINSLSHIGRVAYFENDKDLYHGMNLLLLRTPTTSDSKFLFYLLSSSKGKAFAKSHAKSAVNQASISTTDIKSFKVNLPTLVEQQKIATVLTNGDNEIERLEQQLADLKQEKKALMQQLLTGKRRVIIDDKEVA